MTKFIVVVGEAIVVRTLLEVSGGDDCPHTSCAPKVKRGTEALQPHEAGSCVLVRVRLSCVCWEYVECRRAWRIVT